MEHQEILNGIGEIDMNPLIKKFEEVYGKKPVEGELIEQLAGGDILTMGCGGSDTIHFGPPFPSANSPDIFSLGGIDTITKIPLPVKKQFSIPHTTLEDQQFCRVIKDMENDRAKVTSISAEIDSSFNGFGGQIKYTVEITGTYP